MFKQYLSQINYVIFFLLRPKCKLQSKLDYNKYINKTQNNLKIILNYFGNSLKNPVHPFLTQ